MRNNVKLTLAGISWNEYPCYKTEIRSKMEREKDGCFPSFFERIYQRRPQLEATYVKMG